MAGGDVLGVGVGVVGGVHVPDDHEGGVVGKVSGDGRVEAHGKIREICCKFIRWKLACQF